MSKTNHCIYTKHSYLPIAPLPIMRLSRLVYSGTMMKYASLRKDNDGEGWEMDRKPETQTKRLYRRE